MIRLLLHSLMLSRKRSERHQVHPCHSEKRCYWATWNEEYENTFLTHQLSAVEAEILSLKSQKMLITTFDPNCG